MNPATLAKFREGERLRSLVWRALLAYDMTAAEVCACLEVDRRVSDRTLQVLREWNWVVFDRETRCWKIRR